MNKKIIINIASAIIIGGISFYAGVKYGQGKNLTVNRNANGNWANLSNEERQARMQAGAANIGRQAGGLRANGNNNGVAMGEILAKDDKSVTLKLRDGGSKIVFFSATTQITKSAAGAPSDLEVGENLIANGTANQDGTINAQSIQIRPAMSDQPRPAQQ